MSTVKAGNEYSKGKKWVQKQLKYNYRQKQYWDSYVNDKILKREILYL